MTTTTARLLAAAADHLDRHGNRPANGPRLSIALTLAAADLHPTLTTAEEHTITRAAYQAAPAIPDNTTCSTYAKQLRDTTTAPAPHTRRHGTTPPPLFVCDSTVLRVLENDPAEPGRVHVQPVEWETPGEDNEWRPAGWVDSRPSYWLYTDHLKPVA